MVPPGCVACSCCNGRLGGAPRPTRAGHYNNRPAALHSVAGLRPLRHNQSMDLKPFEQRRRELMQHMGEGVAIVPTAPARIRNRDVEYPYRPDSDFYYLTHFPEPEAVAVLVPGRPHGEFILFCRERDAEKEIWDGRRAGLE